MTKEDMITEILIRLKASGTHTNGEIFFGLAFRTESELRKICSKLNINTRQ